MSCLFSSDTLKSSPDLLVLEAQSEVPTSEVEHCSCRGTCATVRCSCVKGKQGCLDACACLPIRCKNSHSRGSVQQV